MVYLVKDYLKEVFSMEIPALMDSIEDLCFRDIVINDKGKIIFYEAKWYEDEEYHEIKDQYLPDKISSIIERSGRWVNSGNVDNHSFTYIPSGFTIYRKQGIIVPDEQ